MYWALYSCKFSKWKANPTFTGNNYCLYTDGDLIRGSGCSFFIEGTVLPRSCEVNTYKSYSDLIISNYQKYGANFINHIKGKFTIIELHEESFAIYSDHFGINKYFYYSDPKGFIISSDINNIISYAKTSVSPESSAIYALTYHFLDGNTIFKGVYHNRAAQKLLYCNGKLVIDRYWYPEYLLSLNKRNVSIEDISDLLVQIIRSILNRVNSNKISHSITGGMDSRLILSIIRKIGVNAHLYTYGNPESADCKIAKMISEEIGANHSVYDIAFDMNSFRKEADYCIELGESLASLHRAHRLAAIRKEAAHADTMFLSTMGGEFIKGANRSDYIVADFIYNFRFNNNFNYLIGCLKDKCVNIEAVDTKKIMDLINNIQWLISTKNLEFNALFEISASLHHSQNDLLYSKLIPNIITPFIDIDYLELLFSSRYNFLAKNKNVPHFLNRMRNPEFACRMQKYLDPELAKIKYANGFSANEYLKNPIYAAFVSRERKKKLYKVKNFPLGKWMKEYITFNLQRILESNTPIKQIFNVEELLREIKNKPTGNTESFWLKFSTPVQIFRIMEIYSK
jgi:hypothetical protein